MGNQGSGDALRNAYRQQEQEIQSRNPFVPPQGNPPRKTSIRGQDHLLAYITPDEANLLKSRGGSGEPGPMGVPAFIGDNWGGGYSSTSGGERDFSGPAADFSGEEGDDFSGNDYAGSYGTKTGKVGSGNYYGSDGTNKGFSYYEAPVSFGDFFSDLFEQLLNPPMEVPQGQVITKEQALAQLDARAKRSIENPDIFQDYLFGGVTNINRDNLRAQIEAGGTPVTDVNGELRGVFHEGLFGATVYSGMPIEGYPSTGWKDPNDRGDNDLSQYAAATGSDPFIKLKNQRATAYNTRAQALADAFGIFNDDYYNDLSTAFKDVNSGGIQTAYDDALRGIYQGFKQQGIFDQGAFDDQVAALNAQKAQEDANLEQAAQAYADSQKKAVAEQQQKLANALSGIVGGATNEAEYNQQIKDINEFNFDNEVAKLKAAGPEAGSVEFFKDFNKVAAPSVTGASPDNVPPLSTGVSELSPSAFVQSTGTTGSSSGISSPFSGSSVKVI
jgi:hypothetical protein